MASLAEFEGRVIYERLSKGKRRKASEGGYTGGWLPYGYRRAEDGSVQVVPEEAEVVRRIFAWAAEGKNLPWIARQLQADNVPTKKGGKWRPSTLGRMLNNPFYTGRISLDGQLIPGKHEAIVSFA